MSQKSNQPLLADLTDAQRNAIMEGADAVKTLNDYRRKSFDLWMSVARGVAVLCEIADRPGMSRKARQHLLNDNGYGTLNAGTVSRLRRMAEHEVEIRAWRNTLTHYKREQWGGPTTICNRCPAVRKAIAEANASKPKRERRVDRPKAVEAAIDTIADYLHSVADADQRASIVERLLAMARQFESIAKAEFKKAGAPPQKPKRAAQKAPPVTDAQRRRVEKLNALVGRALTTLR